MTTPLDDRRKRILYRANHRGMKEADVMLGGYVSANIADLRDDQLDRLESLLDELDVDIMDWVMGKKAVPVHHDHDVYAEIIKYKPYE